MNPPRVSPGPSRILRGPLSGLARLDRRVYLLSGANLVRSVGRSASWIFLPLILLAAYHLTYLQIGILIAVIVPVGAGANLLGGSSSDRHGRRALSTFPSFGVALASLALYFLWDSGLPLMMVLWGASSFLTNLQRPAQSAMVGDITSPQERVSAFGVVRVFNNLGFAISPAVGGLLAETYGLNVVFLIAAGATAMEGVLLLLFLRESHPGTSEPTGSPGPASAPRGWWTSMRGPFGDAVLVSFGVLGVGLTLATQQFGTALALFSRGVQGLSYSQVGLLYSLNGLFVVLLQLPISWAIRHRYLEWLAVGSLLYGSSFLLFLGGGGYALDLAGVGVLTLGEDVVSPLQNSIVAGMSGAEERGSYFGAYSLMTSIAQAFAPFLGTLLLGISAQGPLLLWGSMAGLTVVVAGGYLYLAQLRKAARRSAPPAGPIPS